MMAKMAAVSTRVRDDDGGGGTDNGALASLAVPCLPVQHH